MPVVYFFPEIIYISQLSFAWSDAPWSVINITSLTRSRQAHRRPVKAFLLELLTYIYAINVCLFSMPFYHFCRMLLDFYNSNLTKETIHYIAYGPNR